MRKFCDTLIELKPYGQDDFDTIISVPVGVKCLFPASMCWKEMIQTLNPGKNAQVRGGGVDTTAVS
jgi:hypothetical protein